MWYVHLPVVKRHKYFFPGWPWRLQGYRRRRRRSNPPGPFPRRRCCSLNLVVWQTGKSIRSAFNFHFVFLYHLLYGRCRPSLGPKAADRNRCQNPKPVLRVHVRAPFAAAGKLRPWAAMLYLTACGIAGQYFTVYMQFLICGQASVYTVRQNQESKPFPVATFPPLALTHLKHFLNSLRTLPCLKQR